MASRNLWCFTLIILTLFNLLSLYSYLHPLTNQPQEINGASVLSPGNCSIPRVKDKHARPLVTLFTTIKEESFRRQFHLNTIRNWASFGSWVEPYLFLQNVTSSESGMTSLIQTAISHGWKVVEVGQTVKGIPVFKSMFQTLSTRVTTPFLAYANADILFDDGLIRTLIASEDQFPDHNTRTMLITGRRRNADQDTVLSTPEVHCPELVFRIGQRYPLYVDKSADYFIVSRAGFRWEAVPDFVVGRIGYDTWLLAMANNWGTTLVDASGTITALHQTGPDGIRAGEEFSSDPLMNRDLFNNDINIGPGKHKCAKWQSNYVDACRGQHCDVMVERRLKRPDKCQPKHVV